MTIEHAGLCWRGLRRGLAVGALLLLSACVTPRGGSRPEAEAAVAPQEPVVFTREILEGACYQLPYGVDAATYRRCIGEAARLLLPPFDPAHPENFGSEYDPAKYAACMQSSKIDFTRYPLRDGTLFQRITVYKFKECEKYKRLKPYEPEVWPTALRPIWPALPDGRIYNPPDIHNTDPEILHRKSGEYFSRLCKGEAKETILRTAENVAGVYFIRPNVDIHAGEYREPHLLEYLDGIGSMQKSIAPFRPATAPDATRQADWYPNHFGTLPATRALIRPGIIYPKRDYTPSYPAPPFRPDELSFQPAYEFIEIPRWEVSPTDPQPYMHAARNPKLDLVPGKNRGQDPYWVNSVPVFTPLSQPRARYGVTWRGFEASPGDRALGIYGNEYLIVDLHTGEIMASMRTFVFSGRPDAPYWAQHGGWLDGAAHCREYPVAIDLLKRVLKPRNTFRIGASES